MPCNRLPGLQRAFGMGIVMKGIEIGVVRFFKNIFGKNKSMVRRIGGEDLGNLGSVTNEVPIGLFDRIYEIVHSFFAFNFSRTFKSSRSLDLPAAFFILIKSSRLAK